MTSKKDQTKTQVIKTIDIKEEPINVMRATQEMLKGVYSNIAMITHTVNEFKIDFAVKFAEKDAHLAARVVMSPPQMKALLSAIQENFNIYEERYGIVVEKPEPKS